MHYYQHHIGDFIRDTSRLTDSQAMAYLRLLWMYYDKEQPISDAQDVLAFKIGCDKETVNLLLTSFFFLQDGVWRNSRCDKDIADYHNYIESQRAKGMLGGRPRKSHGKPAALPQESHGKPGVKPNQQPLTNNQDIDTKVSRPLSRTPTQRLLEIFHQKCDYLPTVTVFSDARRRTLQSRYREVMNAEKWTEDQTIEWFGDFYGLVNDSKFLTGRASVPPGKRAFKADWDWIHAPSNFVKIVEAKYVD